MAENTKTRRRTREDVPVLRTFARAPIASISGWREIDDGIGVCRITVLGTPPGPASSPPRTTFYVKDGGYPEHGHQLRPDEARRCAASLHVGDWVELIGNVGPERDKARRQEVVVTEQVKLKKRAEVEADADDPGVSAEEGSEVISRPASDGARVPAGVAA
jgi:hypothetical protein